MYKNTAETEFVPAVFLCILYYFFAFSVGVGEISSGASVGSGVSVGVTAFGVGVTGFSVGVSAASVGVTGSGVGVSVGSGSTSFSV